jgi:hypothetical protein
MTRSWERNTLGLRAHAQQKAVETARRAEAAIAQLLKEQRPVNFKTVAETAGISTAWLYGREQASSASKDAVIAALRQRIKKLEEEDHMLKQQMEVANGLLYQQG